MILVIKVGCKITIMFHTNNQSIMQFTYLFYHNIDNKQKIRLDHKKKGLDDFIIKAHRMG